MIFGSLEFLNAAEHPELLAVPVMEALQSLPSTGEVGVSEIDPTLSDTAAFCEKYQIGVEQAANCVILEAKRGEQKWFAACVVLGSTRADINGVVRRLLDAKKVSFAPMEAAVAQSGMEFGAITPVGLPCSPAGGWPILVDQAVADSATVIIGSGVRKSKLLVPGTFFATLPNAQIVEGLAQPKS
jgi:prolyl-tRNA editing enzyme YbaK/EbsC (Cys-tRNA(Pro) deacylase)